MVWIIWFVTLPKSLTKELFYSRERMFVSHSCSLTLWSLLTSLSSPIVVFNDQNPLTFVHKMKNKNQRLLRWSLLLQEYNLDMRHIRGKDNIISDTVSRT